MGSSTRVLLLRTLRITPANPHPDFRELRADANKTTGFLKRTLKSMRAYVAAAQAQGSARAALTGSIDDYLQQEATTKQLSQQQAKGFRADASSDSNRFASEFSDFAQRCDAAQRKFTSGEDGALKGFEGDVVAPLLAWIKELDSLQAKANGHQHRTAHLLREHYVKKVAQLTKKHGKLVAASMQHHADQIGEGAPAESRVQQQRGKAKAREEEAGERLRRNQAKLSAATADFEAANAALIAEMRALRAGKQDRLENVCAGWMRFQQQHMPRASAEQRG